MQRHTVEVVAGNSDASNTTLFAIGVNMKFSQLGDFAFIILIDNVNKIKEKIIANKYIAQKMKFSINP